MLARVIFARLLISKLRDTSPSRYVTAINLSDTLTAVTPGKDLMVSFTAEDVDPCGLSNAKVTSDTGFKRCVGERWRVFAYMNNAKESAIVMEIKKRTILIALCLALSTIVK